MSASKKIEPIPARIIGGPIEFRDYDHLRLAVEHTVVKPDGSTMTLPPGTLLIMNKPGGHIEQQGGTANKNEGAIDARDGRS